jgi:membrane-associated phospholipid phosphatase
VWRRKLWEMHTGLLGLGVALAGAFIVTEGLKDLYGKPRPDFISRCDPNLEHIRDHVVGGLSNFLQEAPPIVSWTICRNKTKMVSHDGFASFPSGHSSFSWAGMTYLTLFLCAKFNIAIPFLAPRGYTRSNSLTLPFSKMDEDRSTGSASDHIPLRNQAAAPPVLHMILAFVPLAVAAYIASTRWGDYRHQGFDIIAGSLLGIGMAWLGFRMYHLPIQRGSGWSWGARTRQRAFGVEVGVSTHVGDEGWERAKLARRNEHVGNGPQHEEEPTLTSGGLADEEQGVREAT